MALQKFDRSKWMDVCAAASVELLGKRAEIEVVSPENAWQIVLLRDPLMLPRPAEIT